MTTANSSTIFNTNADTSLNVREALNRILSKQKLSRDQLANELYVDVDVLGAILDDSGSDNVAHWLAVHDRLVHVLRQHGQLHQGAECEETTLLDALDEASTDPFA